MCLSSLYFYWPYLHYYIKFYIYCLIQAALPTTVDYPCELCVHLKLLAII